MKHFISGLTKLTAASILVVSLVACGGADERKAKYLEKSKEYLAEKSYDKARIEIKNVLQIDPKFAEAYYMLGQLEEQKKELGKALGNYKKAIELSPEYTLAKVKLAKIYVIAGTDKFIKDAKVLLSQVKQEQPDNTEAELISATIEYKTGSKSKAAAAIKSVVARDPGLVSGVSLLATIYIADGNQDKAISLLKKSVLDNPENIPLRVSLARLYVAGKDYSNAEVYMKQAVALDPDSFSLMSSLASLYVAANDTEKAESTLKRSIDSDPEDPKRYVVLISLYAKSDVQKAEDFLLDSIKNNPDLYDLQFAQFEFYMQLNKKEEAKQLLKNIIEKRSYKVEGVNARNLLAKYLLAEGDQDGAQKYIDEVMSEYPNNNDALFLKSKIALRELDAVTAINGLRTIVKNDPKNSDASLLLAQAHELNDESSLAENELKKAIEVNPVNDQVHVNYARYLASKVVDKALTYFKESYDLLDVKLKIMASLKRDDEIVALLGMMETVDPRKAEVNIIKGKYYLSKAKNELAVDQFEKAFNKAQDKFEPLQLIVKTYIVNKQPEKALTRLNAILDVNPDSAPANLLTGQVYLTQKKYEEARVKFIKASNHDQQWMLPYTNLATSYMIDNNIDKALSVYKDAESKLKNKEPALIKIAAIYEQKKDYPAAMKVYEKIITENSRNKLAANNYASLLLDYGREADAVKALDLAKSFEMLEQPALQDTLAWAHAKTGDNAKAIHILKPIVDKAPEVAVFRYHLGYALNGAGDAAAAKSHLEIAVSSDQDFPGKSNAKELLKSL